MAVSDLFFRLFNPDASLSPSNELIYPKEPFNPYSCGANLECPYNTRCHAEAAGYNIDSECCQAPQPSACGQM